MYLKDDVFYTHDGLTDKWEHLSLEEGLVEMSQLEKLIDFKKVGKDIIEHEEAYDFSSNILDHVYTIETEDEMEVGRLVDVLGLPLEYHPDETLRYTKVKFIYTVDKYTLAPKSMYMETSASGNYQGETEGYESKVMRTILSINKDINILMPQEAFN